jgi:TonB-linked SusC/RagA family outer membrane protein
MGIEGFVTNARAGRLWACERLRLAAAFALLPAALAAQQPTVITGRVTSTAGTPLGGAQITAPALGVGTTARGDGTYTVLIPAARVPTGPITVNARLIGYKLSSTQVTLSGPTTTADFQLAENPLQLGEVVVTGAGTTSEVEKLGTVRNNIDSTAIQHSNEQNLVNALAAKAPNVSVVSSSGDPGASSYIQIRGLTTIEASSGQPLFVVDGVPVDNSVNFNNIGNQGLNGGNINPPNALLNLNPDDIESLEVLKGASSGAIYGSRAGQGVVLITTKHGRAGQTKYSLRSSWSLDEHTQLPALQSEYGQGSGGVAASCAGVGCVLTGTSYGPKLDPSTPTFDHLDEIFQHGYTTDNALSISGGSDNTTFFLSGGYSYNRGIVVGDNNHYRRISVRFNGTQQITKNLKVGGNVAYVDGSGDFVQSRNSTAGLLLGAWRTTPTFNNLPFLDPATGQQRSYRFPDPGPGTEASSRIYDNPFFTANEDPATSNVGRTFGGVNGEWTPLPWLTFAENLGLDYSNDERFEAWALSNSNGSPPAGVQGVGGLNVGYLRTRQVDNNVTATVRYNASKAWKGTVTVGQNLNSQTFTDRETLGTGLIAPQPFNLGNTASNLPPFDFNSTVHLESYFGQATADLFDQFYLTAAIRNDGASTFGAASQRNWFPKGSAAWVFRKTAGEGNQLISYGKLRAAYGQSGTQPTPYLLPSVFNSVIISDGGFGPASSTKVGPGGLVTRFNLPTQTLGPERVKEFEAGLDLGLFGDKADLSVTHYRDNSDGVIISIPVPTSTGYSLVPANAASLQNRGWEVTLNVRPITKKDFAWDVGLQWARNRGITTSLANGVQFDPFPLSGGTNGLGGIQGVAIVGQPIGVYYGTDYVRCGRGSTVDFIPIDNTPTSGGGCGNAPKGALYIGADGFPRIDTDSQWVLGDPNPDWTGSIRTNFRFGKISIGGLLDIRHGGVAYNGTTGALNQFGVAQRTADARDALASANPGAPGLVIFGQNYFPQHDPGPAAGPGAGLAVPLDQNWWTGAGGVFSGVATPFIEDGGFVKLREVSIGYTLDKPWVSRSLGFSSIELRLAGRNLTSWNNYDGVDPETAILGAASPVRGIDYFNNPQTRSWNFSITLNR